MNLRSALSLMFVLMAIPAVAQEREWSLDASEDEAFMIFGVPESDDVGVSFWCALRSGEVRIFVPEASDTLKPEDTIDVTLKVGDKTFPVTAKTLPNEEAASTSIEITVPAGDPMFGTLAEEDSFSLAVGPDTLAFPLSGTDFPELLRACGRQ